jgi:hypothetical protein
LQWALRNAVTEVRKPYTDLLYRRKTNPNIGALIHEGGGQGFRSSPIVSIEPESGGSAPEFEGSDTSAHYSEAEDDEFPIFDGGGETIIDHGGEANFDDGNDAILDDGNYDEPEGCS